MRAPRGDSEQTKAEILRAARKLFADNGILAVSVRDVAREAGVTHGLVHHYFGTKEQLTEEVIRREVELGGDVLLKNPIDSSADSLKVMRDVLKLFLTERASSGLLLARAELTGFQPEKLMPEGRPASLEIMAKRFAELQEQTNPEGPRLDPALISICIGGAVFGLVTMHEWLMTAAGLDPATYESRIEEIVDIAIAFIAKSVGVRGA